MKLTEELLDGMGFEKGTGFPDLTYVYNGDFWVIFGSKEPYNGVFDGRTFIAEETTLKELVECMIEVSCDSRCEPYL